MFCSFLASAKDRSPSCATKLQTLSLLSLLCETLLYSCPGHYENTNVSCPGEGFRGKDCKCYCKGNSEDTGICKSLPYYI